MLLEVARLEQPLLSRTRSMVSIGKQLSKILSIIAISLIFLFGLSVANSATAQILNLSLEEAKERLVGDGHKEWVLEKVVTVLGVERECEQGETYLFRADDSVIHKLCVDGRWQSTTENWSVTNVDDLDRIIVLNGETYLLLIREVGDEEQVRLNQRADSKEEYSREITLSYELD